MDSPKLSKRRMTRAVARLASAASIQWEACEPRLVLSAQFLSDVLDPMQLQLHGATSPLLGIEAGAAPNIEPHTPMAHQLSGWNAMHQEFGLKGDGQTVAVIDSGIAWNHVALGKGFGAGYRVVGGWDFAENDSNPYDDGPTGFHGTHVAGIVGSDSAKSLGVAPGVDLVGLRVFNDAGQGQMQWVEQALAWVHSHRNSFANPITTVNLSLGATWNAHTIPNWGTLEDELRQLYDDGIVVTASAGNSFKQVNAPGLSYPAASPYVLPVASVDDNGLLSDFSQRSGRVLAAPGRNIFSTVPDHVLGRDGKIDDFTTATGTSMAAPYVAGASVLVREAMEMVGLTNITSAKIINWLHTTADTIFDAATNANYHRLDLQSAIDTLLPDDDVGNSAAQGQSINLNQKSISGWLNTVQDADVYRFTTGTAGQLTLDADSKWIETLRWDLTSGGQSIASGNLAAQTLQLQANQTYELRIGADQEIGSFQLGMNFKADAVAPPPPVEIPVADTHLGKLDFLHKEVVAGAGYRATAMHDGIFTVQWTNADAAHGNLVVRDAAGGMHADATWENGTLRLDLNAKAGQTFDIRLPGSTSDVGSLIVADVVELRNNELVVRGTSASNTINLDLSRGVGIDYGGVHYDYQTGQFARIRIDGAANTDQLTIVGSAAVDRVDLKPTMVALDNGRLSVVATAMEQVHFDGGASGVDRVYMYDSNGNDTLNARPQSAELVGTGYRLSVENVDRLFFQATGRGEDVAYLADSAGNDQLTVRPQYSTLSGDGYFNSLRGFGRVYVNATAGGFDTADIYDSSGNDRFSSNGDTASIEGKNYSSTTRYFEQVRAHATAGGHDVATLYGASQQTQWQRGSDFTGYREASWSRNVHGFETVETYVAGQVQSLASEPPVSSLASPSTVDSSTSHEALDNAQACTPFSISTSSIATFATTSHFEPITLEAAQRDDQRLEPGANSINTATAAASGHDAHDLAAQLLVDALQLHDELTAEPAVDELRWHTDPSAERELLDAIFSRHL